MGNLVWHEYSRFVSITASLYALWSAFFAIFYRKFFWDFVGGTLRDPGGLQAPPSAAPFIMLVVKMPVVPILTILISLFMTALELPLPALKKMAIHRSIVLRIVVLLFQTFFTILYYQGTNAALWSFIAAMCYTRAQMKGETMEVAKENRGRGGKA